jgi:hypothetical protein
MWVTSLIRAVLTLQNEPKLLRPSEGHKFPPLLRLLIYNQIHFSTLFGDFLIRNPNTHSELAIASYF